MFGVKKMDRVIELADYGICLFSMNVMEKFLKSKKIKSKKLLNYLQKNHDTYIDSLKQGIWIPFLPINAIEYILKLENNGDTFDEDWERKIEYSGFNIDVDDSLWIADIARLSDFDREDFADNDISYQTLDHQTIYAGFCFNLPSGKYNVSIKGYKRKNPLDHPCANFGFLFSLVEVNEFNEYKDPREDEIYDFNVAKM